MNVFQLLNGNNYLTINRSMAHEIGLFASMILSELLDKMCYFEAQGVTDQGWFYLTVPQIQQRTTLAKEAQKTAIEKLVEMGFIETKLRGIPAKRYFRVFKERIIEWVNSGFKNDENYEDNGEDSSSWREPASLQAGFSSTQSTSRQQYSGDDTNKQVGSPPTSPYIKSPRESPTNHSIDSRTQARPQSKMERPSNETEKEKLERNGTDGSSDLSPEMAKLHHEKKLEWMKKITFPDYSTISNQNMRSWADMFSIWKIMKCTCIFKAKLQRGDEIENPQGYFFTILKNPKNESTMEIERTRMKLGDFLDENEFKNWIIDADYACNDSYKKEFPLTLGLEKIIEEIGRFENARK